LKTTARSWISLVGSVSAQSLRPSLRKLALSSPPDDWTESDCGEERTLAL
jgi:hypothetical protein